MKNVALFLKDGFDINYASAINDVLTWNNKVGNYPITALKTGVNETVTSSFGSQHAIDVPIQNLSVENIDVIVYSNAFAFFNGKEIMKYPSMSALELAFKMLEQLSSKENVKAVKAVMKYPMEMCLCA